MIKTKKDALEALAVVKGYLNNVVMDAKQPVELIKTNLYLLDEVQLFIDPKADLNKIQEEVNNRE